MNSELWAKWKERNRRAKLLNTVLCTTRLSRLALNDLVNSDLSDEAMIAAAKALFRMHKHGGRIG